MNSELTFEMLAGVPMPLVLIGSDGRIMAVNGPAETVLGAGIAGRLFPTAFRQPALLNCIEAGLNDATPGVGRHVLQGKGGDQVFRVTVSPVSGGVLCAFEDVSEQEQIGQMRRDFVANVSHELRTPLTALLGFIETLQGAAREDSAARDRFLAVMAREAERMNRLVGDLLSLSRVEAQERVRPTQIENVAGLVTRVISDLRPMAEAVGVTIEAEGVDAAALVPADADQIIQVLTNLIENAVKYGGSGEVVRVAVRHDPRDASLRAAALRIDVSDQGEGIDAVHLPRLTERFYRVDAHRSREKGGTGLGLAIVKHIVNRHRGRFVVASEKGKGSTFSVILPMQ